MKELVFYHAHCMDGTGAAAAYVRANRPHDKQFTLKDIRYTDMESLDKFKSFMHSTTTVIKNYSNDGIGQLYETTDKVFPDACRLITFLDFCPTREVLTWLLKNNHTVLILDHHQTGREMMENLIQNPGELNEIHLGNLCFVFGCKNMSGASMASLLTEVFYNNYDIPSTDPVTIPLYYRKKGLNVKSKFSVWTNAKLKNKLIIQESEPLYELLRIRDVWDVSSEVRKEQADCLSAYFSFYNLSNLIKFDTWVNKNSGLNKVFKAVDEGGAIIEILEKQMMDVIDRAYQTELNLTDGRKLQLVIASCINDQASMLGDLWSKKWAETDHPAISIALFHNYKTGRLGFGMRSNEHIDCKPLAEFLGGGGHFKACGGDLSRLVVPAGFDHVDYDVAVEPGQFIEKLRDELVYAATQVYKTV